MPPQKDATSSSSSNYLQLQQQQQQQHLQQRRHSSYQQQARFYNNSISDDSLNRSRRESFACMRSASPPVRRLSASCLQEELCALGHQLHIDPRYRDTRPIARSASSLYLSNEPNSGYYQPPAAAPHFSPMRPLRRTPPPSIYIEEYLDEPAPLEQEARNSQESFTNFASYSDAHQPLNEEGIASMADSGDIPFIDDEEEQQQQQQQRPCIATANNNSSSSNSFAPLSTVKRNPAAGYRKTVSFDLEQPAPTAATGSTIDRRYHTHDAISNFAVSNSSTESLLTEQQTSERMPLIQKIRRELNTKRATNCSAVDYSSGGSGSNSQRSSSESIERMPLLRQPTQQQQQQQQQQQSPYRRQLNAQRSHKRSGLRATAATTITTTTTTTTTPTITTTAAAGDPLFSLQVPSNSSCACSRTQNVHKSNQYCASTTTLKPSTTEFPNSSNRSNRSNRSSTRRASSHTNLSPSYLLPPLGQGLVREMAAHLDARQSLAPSKTKSKSTSALAAVDRGRLTHNEQDDIIKQLKEWSLFGSAGKDYNVQLPQLSCECPCCEHCRGVDSNRRPAAGSGNNNNDNDNDNVTATFKCYDSCQAADKEPLAPQTQSLALARQLPCRRSVMCNNRQAHSVRQLKRNKQQRQKQRHQQHHQRQHQHRHQAHHSTHHQHHQRQQQQRTGSPPSTAKLLLSLASGSNNCSCSEPDDDDDNDDETCSCSCSSSDCVQCAANNKDDADADADANARPGTGRLGATATTLLCAAHR